MSMIQDGDVTTRLFVCLLTGESNTWSIDVSKNGEWMAGECKQGDDESRIDMKNFKYIKKKIRARVAQWLR